MDSGFVGLQWAFEQHSVHYNYGLKDGFEVLVRCVVVQDFKL